MTKKLDLYTWPTPNGHKIHIMLEECGLPYNVIAVDIGAGDQFKPEFLKISPNNKMPALVDPDGPGGKPISIFESGAILMYLAEKTGKFMPKEPRGRYLVLVHYWGACLVDAGLVDVTLSIAVEGSTIGSYRASLAPNERNRIVAFYVE